MDAFAVLKNYCEKNPGNLNAHKYLYNFCKEHFPEHEDKISSLQVRHGLYFYRNEVKQNFNLKK
jgi:hypothetical protein